MVLVENDFCHRVGLLELLKIDKTILIADINPAFKTSLRRIWHMERPSTQTTRCTPLPHTPPFRAFDGLCARF